MTRPCPECDGFGVITAAYAEHPDSGRRSGFYENICPECDGEGEVEITCLCCESELDEHGFCAPCDDFALTEIHRISPTSIAA